MRPFLMVIFLFFVSLASAQFPDNPESGGGGEGDGKDRKSRWVVGGTLGASSGTNFTNISISPSVGKVFMENHLISGIDISYNYIERFDDSWNIFGFGPFLNYLFLQSFFVRGKYEYLTGQRDINNISEDISESAIWLGGGIAQSISGQGVIYVGFEVNTLYDRGESVYASGFRPYAGVHIVL